MQRYSFIIIESYSIFDESFLFILFIFGRLRKILKETSRKILKKNVERVTKNVW